MTSSDPLWPPALTAGARVALVAPSGPLGDVAELERAQANARAFGWEPVVGANAMSRAGYLAGDDLVRQADLDEALRGDVDGIWCLRGGYGAMRLLDALDWTALARRPRALLGFSDITALHLAVAARVPGLVSYHGPTARGTLTPFSRDSLGRAVVARTDPCGLAPDAVTLRPGRAAGRLAGGNVALLAALVGTPYAPNFDGAIVVLEDVGEPMYRVDRMLRQLLLAGTFAGCRALVFGHCTDCTDSAGGAPGAGVRSLADVVGEIAERLRVPAMLGVPVGHIDDQWTIPLGARAEVDVDARTLHAYGAPSVA